MKGILKSSALCSRQPQRNKTVSFPAGTALCADVHEADEWDRTPVAATRKLSYQDILELKEMQIALLKNTPAFPQLLSTVPVGLVPLLPPEQPQTLQKVASSAFEKVDEVGHTKLTRETPLDSAPSPPIPISVPSQSVTPKRKFYLPIVPLQEPSPSPSRAVRTSPPLPPSPTRSSSPASSFSSSPPFTSPLSGRTSPFGRSASPASPSGSFAAYRTPIPRISTPPTSRNADSIALHQQTSIDSLPTIPFPGPSFNSHRFNLPPSFLGIYGSHNAFRDILPPNPLFVPYSIATTRPNIYSPRISPPIVPIRRLDN